MPAEMTIQLPEKVAQLVGPQALQSYGLLTAQEADLRKRLQDLQTEDLFTDSAVDPPLAMCCISGLWLLHNFLDESHSISQDISTSEGSYWHAIMHRWEGDFSNSKYWYRHVGPHPAIDRVSSELGSRWDPFEFVDRCESETRRGGLDRQTLDIAVVEWKSLFEYCFTHATA
jgi:hypothetical protein